MPLPSGGPLRAIDINRELGRPDTATMRLSGSAERALAQRPSGTIRYSDFRNKRATPAYVLIGSASNATQLDSRYDSGVRSFAWNNISRGTRIRTRVWATISGSHRNNGPAGYVYVRWIFKTLTGGLILDTTRIDKWTQGDGAGGIGNWSQAYYISQLIGNGENVRVEVQMRFITGSYTAHIWGGQNYLNRMCGIESEIGY